MAVSILTRELSAVSHPIPALAISRRSCRSSTCLGTHRDRRPPVHVRRSSQFEQLRTPKMNAEGLVQRVRQDVAAGEEQVKERGDVKEARARAAGTAAATKGGLRTLAVAVAIPLVAGIVDSVINSPTSQWYTDLKKPWWNPPGWLFGAAWSILYPLMGLASWLVWVEGGWKRQSQPLSLYALQLVLNLLWPALFFGVRNITLAVVDIVALVVVLAATIAAFKPANHVAANLLKPYLAWVAFASALTLDIWLKNRGGEQGGDATAAE